MSKQSNILTDTMDPHVERRRSILNAHPEVKKLFGRNPATFGWISLFVLIQVGVAYLLRNESLWLVIVIAYLFGAFINHALFCLKHECTHNLVFKNKTANMLTGILGNLTSIAPSYAVFSSSHLKHHSHQGEYELDFDLPLRWEAKLIDNTPYGKVLWMFLQPFAVAFRPFRKTSLQYVSVWTFINILAVFLFDFAILYFFGTTALLYMFFSIFFGLGLHPLGARWIQEHYVVHVDQETYSYYGWLNKITFNIGHHNEHHDFPGIPWNNLPKLRKTAPEFYDTLYYHNSWSKLLLKFFTDKNLSLYSRIERPV
ncbi:MAG: fatty acid desaturase, partial [Balneolaceae bacterium]